MESLYNEYLNNMRQLVSVFIEKYRDQSYNDFTEANEFLLDYSFGKYDRGENVMNLEKKYMESLDKIINIESNYTYD
tara:strand:- start:413 stop:643 length:231 start_codon:yes stop_codon:yes gene_type:complete